MNNDSRFGLMLFLFIGLLAMGMSLAAMVKQDTEIRSLEERLRYAQSETEVAHEIALEMIALLGVCNADDGDGLSPR